MQAVITEASPLVGKTIAETALVRLREARIIDVRRDSVRRRDAAERTSFRGGRSTVARDLVAGVKGIREMPGVVFEPEAELGVESTGTREAILMEGIIGSRSTFVGHTLRDLNFRQRYGVLILAVHRQGENLREKFEDVDSPSATRCSCRDRRRN